MAWYADSQWPSGGKVCRLARAPDLELKAALLDQIVFYLADRGLGDVSLRPLARALDISLNGLVHHFGTKDEMVVAALSRSIKIQDDVQRRWIGRNPGLSQADLHRRWWRWINSSPRNLALVRLGLEAATLDATVSHLPGSVRAEQIGVWRTDIEQRLASAGLSAEAAELEASLVKALFTGLVIDLMATGERVRLTRSLEVGLTRLEAVVQSAQLATAQ